MGRVFNQIIQLLGIRGIKDTQCGFKMFRGAAARQIFSEFITDGFAFDVEALLRARQLGLEIRETPVRWINSPDSRVRIVRDSLKMLCEALRIKIKLKYLRQHSGKSARNPTE